jgi:5-methylcytosine-specific restriction endonuclease McrA
LAAAWTEARKHGFIVAVLRAGTRRWPPKYEALNEAKTEKKINEKTKRLAQHYLCAMCENEFTSKDIQVDHIEPVVNPKTGFTSWNDYIPRLFCERSNLQVLCTDCHKTKTKEEKNEAGRKSKRR